VIDASELALRIRLLGRRFEAAPEIN